MVGIKLFFYTTIFFCFLNAVKNSYYWKEEWYDQMPIDHFSFTDNRTFKLRYFINLDDFVSNGPIFFYTGNEGSLESFALNSGFIWDIAPEFKAAVVFAEHRFYGKTRPFGNESFTTVKNLGYLSSEQALADYVELITYLKKEKIRNAKKSPVIAFGGSYGGMLTAWMRIKYPHIIDGGIAASAPVFMFLGTNVSDNTYNKIVTRTFCLSGCNLTNLILSFDSIRKLGKSEKGREFLNNAFHLSNKSKIENSRDANLLLKELKTIMGSMAMVNYPYEANFLAKLPAWPVEKTCKAFISNKDKTDEENALAAFNILNVYYNSTGKVKEFCVIGDCPGPFQALDDGDAWLWQTCTEMIMPHCSSGPPDDIFTRTCPFSIEKHKNKCLNYFKKINYTSEFYRPNWVISNYGAQFPTATNIIFSNGYLDPWSGGGWLLKPDTKKSLVSLIIEDGAHHLDLRGSNINDPKSVREVRRIEKEYIKNWIKEAKNKNYL